jgi:hypothetical protein
MIPVASTGLTGVLFVFMLTGVPLRSTTCLLSIAPTGLAFTSIAKYSLLLQPKILFCLTCR